jgi:hypothetical protein
MSPHSYGRKISRPNCSRRLAIERSAARLAGQVARQEWPPAFGTDRRTVGAQGKSADTPRCARVRSHRSCQSREHAHPSASCTPATMLLTSLHPLVGEVSKAQSSSPGRGGSRNLASRESNCLTRAHTANLIAASGHAKAIGLPFTRMITIHWELAGVPVERMAKATGRFTDLMTKALARHGSGTAWLWVHENGPQKGGHCHMLVHVPAKLASVLTRLQLGWLRSITGKPYQVRVIRSRPVGGRLGLEIDNPALYGVNLEMALAYLLKGVCSEAASHFGLNRLEPGGRVVGKRCGTSQKISKLARMRKTI